jgi:hypothetical protein
MPPPKDLLKPRLPEQKGAESAGGRGSGNDDRHG